MNVTTVAAWCEFVTGLVREGEIVERATIADWPR